MGNNYLLLHFAFVLLSSFVICDAWPTTVPFWPHYPTRYIQVLDGNWSFGFETSFDGDVTATNIDTSSIATPESITVPGVFDWEMPGVLGPRGTAFYRTQVDLVVGSTGLLYFSACSFYCHVFVDNMSLGDHRAGGYVPFAIEVPSSSHSTREIFVIVDNRWNSTTAPVHTGGDFYFFSGITRNVLFHQLPKALYLSRVETLTEDYKKGLINMNIVLSDNVTTAISLSVGFDNDSAIIYQKIAAVNGVASLSSVLVPNAKTWSMEAPNLHIVTVNLLDDNSVVDSIVARFGIRTLGKDSNNRLTINGDTVKLTGYNRHTMWPYTGSALTLPQIEEDISLLKELSANYVRGAHYPQDQRFLDLCDENGIAIWEEALGPGVSTNDIQNPYFMKYQIQQMNEMIDASFNHPCVILHGFFNEGPSNDASACSGYEACANVVRSRIPTTYVTWASNQELNDKCLKYTDVISFNSYPAWYDSQGNISACKAHWNQMAEAVHAQYAQPFTISETGAGGVYEWQNSTAVYWSQLYEQEVVQADVEVALENSYISGITIWQFNDIKADDSDTKSCGQCDYLPKVSPPTCGYINVDCSRPGGENHKGSVDFWRREKSVFSVVQQLYKNVSRLINN